MYRQRLPKLAVFFASAALVASLVPHSRIADARMRPSTSVQAVLEAPVSPIPGSGPAPRALGTMPPFAATRPQIIRGVSRGAGIKMQGPPMLPPSQINAAIRASAHRRAPLFLGAAGVGPSRGSMPTALTLKGAPRTTQSLPSEPAASGTGINRWWGYQEQGLPGVGRAMVNVGTGNLLVQNDDMAVPHKGIAMAFRRTYNAQGAAATNAGAYVNWTSLYGNGWTNTFDAHLLATSSSTVSVYDVDGARYDYAAGANGYTSLTPGQHAVLASDNGCGMTWTKKSGTTYYFWAPGLVSTCSSGAAYLGFAGRLHQIVGRNSNTNLTLTYAWDGGDASATGKISTITVQAESGLTTALNFADVNGRRMLAWMVFPDGPTQTTYAYDDNGNLTAVSYPANATGGSSRNLWYSYAGLGSDWVMSGIAPPRWTSCLPSCSGDGSFTTFSFAGSSAQTSTVSRIFHGGVINIVPNDGTNTPVQPGIQTTATGFLTEWYTTGVTSSSYSDSDGHMTQWTVDGNGRPTKIQDCTASSGQPPQCSSQLTTTETWDADNNLIAETDARGNETDYAYDVHGNTVAVGMPPAAPGAARATKLFTYDGHDNVVAYCDPIAVDALQANWTTRPTAPIPGQGGLCPQTSVATLYEWTAATSEPFGELTAATAPAPAPQQVGYRHTYSYTAGPQGGADYGLPTQVQGAPITQSIDSTTPVRQPQQTFWYDANGNIVCSGTGSGQWLLTYDALGRLTSTADPDDASNGTGVCAKSGAQAGWNTTARRRYFPDGSLASTQTASQIANGVATTFTYDLNGNEKSETHHYGCLAVSGCTAGVTTKWYDGADRLVEVQQPYDVNDVQGYPWSTRYIYDLSGGGVTPYRGMGLHAYGNLAATQELLSGTVWTPSASQTYAISTGTWTDVRATSFDALDRPISSYEAAFGDQPKTTTTYDGAGQQGLVSTVTLATGEVKTFLYDGLGRQTDVSYPQDPNGSITPRIHQDYDVGGRVVSRSTSALGAETLTYDATGALTSVTQPSSLGGGTLRYAYYADGMRSSAGYVDGAVSYPTALQYAYRPDGKRERIVLPNNGSFAWSYTAAGRILAQSDPFLGATVSPDLTYVVTQSGGEKNYYPATVTYGQWTQTYDSYGRAADTTLPVALFKYTGSQYDLEDGLAGLSTSGYSPSPQPATGPKYTTNGSLPLMQSTIRDEKNPGSVPSATSTQSFVAARELNGSWLRTGGLHRTASVDGNWTIDARSGMLLHSTMTTSYDITEGSSFAYDASGRLSQDFEGAAETVTQSGSGGTRSPLFCSTLNASPQMPAYTCYINGSRAKTYDAENRLHSETFSYAPAGTPAAYGSASYGGYWQVAYEPSSPVQPPNIQSVDYGAHGHPVRITLYHPDIAASGSGAPTEVREWLWDGNERFLQCSLQNGHCQSPVLSLEGLGEYQLANGTLTRVNDRGRAGGVTMSHNAAKFSRWSESPTTRTGGTFNAPCSSSQYMDLCVTAHDGKLTADGWTLDFETWQGVRTSDLTVGQWNTPDVYAGEVHDPTSQKPFMWNRNNPYAYIDASGFDTITLYFRPALARDPLKDAHAFIEVRGDKGELIKRYSFGPFGGALKQWGNDYDAEWDGGKKTLGSTPLGSCKGICTVKNGGFDERSLDETAAAIDGEWLRYGFPAPNSNSAAYTLCVHGGGGAKCVWPNSGGHMAPGWGRDILDDRNPADHFPHSGLGFLDTGAEDSSNMKRAIGF